MDSQFCPDCMALPSSPDLNCVAVTGFVAKEPDVMAVPSRGLVTIILLAVEGHLQPTPWGTQQRHTYMIHALARGALAERLASIQAGDRLQLSGSLDYLYRHDAELLAERFILAIRIDDVYPLGAIPSG